VSRLAEDRSAAKESRVSDDPKQRGESESSDDGRFSERFRELERDVFRVCRRLLDSSSAADDAVNEVYLRARRAHGSYDETRPFRPWLLGIAGNHCIDLLRRRQIETRIFDTSLREAEGPSDPGPSPLAQIVDKQQRSALLSEIDALPSHFRLPLVLFYWSDLDYGQIGEVLGVPRGQVGSLLFRARRQLRTSLEKGVAE